MLEKAVVPCGPIYALDEIYENPQIKHRDLVQHTARADGTRLDVAGYPVKLSKTPATARRAPPSHGADTDEVLRGELRLSDEQISALKDGSVVA